MRNLIRLCEKHSKELGKDLRIEYTKNYFPSISFANSCQIEGCSEIWFITYGENIPEERLLRFGYTIHKPPESTNETYDFVENIGNG